KRYLRRGLDGKPAETIEGMFRRVARAVAEPDAAYGYDVNSTEEAFYGLLTSMRFFPNSPTFTGAGTPLGQLAACFVLPISDDLGKNQDGIFQTLRDAALIQQTGGGNGFSFSRLRPKGDKVASSAGVATGPVGFLRVYDTAFGEVAQGGTRRGANMAVLRVDHPDIEEFISCKAQEGQITNFNISVGITDAFMRAVEEDADFPLVNPRDGTVWRTVKARQLFDKMVTFAHHNGEPGALFLDAANRANPLPHLYQLEATNPCGEQWLGPYENCCLGSINLAQHVTDDNRVDWDKLRETTIVATRFLDNVVDANKYVPAVPQLREAALRARRIGLGIMGLGDIMYRLGVRYGSPEGQEFAAQIMEFIRYHSMATSIELARERGPFPVIEGSIYDPADLKWSPPRPLTPYTRDWGRPPLDWDAIVAGIKQHGIRNAAQTTVAPTGTIGTVTGCEGYGCEPVFALAYTRTVKDGDRDLKLTYTSPLFEKALKEAGLDEATRQRISEQVSVTGSCQDVLEVPEAIRRVFVVAQDITAEEHVRMQAAIQAFVDNSISKCVVGHTLILTDEGLSPIEMLSDLRLPDQFAPLERGVVTPEGVEPATLFYYGGYRETRKVTLEYGFEIEGTPNHRIHVLTEEGEIAFRRLDELRPGDTVVLYGSQQQFGRPASPLPAFSGRFRTSSNRLKFPEHMSVELAFLLGCITSEGAITVNGLSISSTDVALLEQLRAIAQALFGLDCYIASDGRNQVHYLQFNSRALRDWLITDLELQAGAENKVIPPCILHASQEEIAAFLRGLFLDGFMTQDGRLFGITLASRRLISQLQVLLLNAGILGTVRQVGERAYSLTVQGGELEQLAEWIGFVEAWKNERIERRNLGRLHRYRNYSRLLPPAVTQALAEMKAQVPVSLRAAYDVADRAGFQAYQRARVNLLGGHRMERQDARHLYETLHRAGARHDFADRFFGHDDDRKIYISVEKVESGFAEVFDISVPGSHTFIANGFANHNTINFPSTATVEDVAAAYKLAWKLGCKGLTVYVAGSRQEVVLETKATSAQKGKEGAAAESKAPAAPQPPPAPAEPPYHAQRRPRPAVLPGMTYRKETPLGTAFITVNVNGQAQPFEVFLNVGKAGSDVASVSEALGRLISLVLRLPSPLDPVERLKLIIDQLAGIGGGRTLGFGAHRVRSLPDAIAQVLREHLNGHFEFVGLVPEATEPAAEQLALPIADRPIGDLCPDCGQATFIATEGCRKCYACGYSEC
ncbi:MAG: adenosylcobalamin-dependent ribonucleoside-diphosphate reductase, partial [Anaerolineae bacterium]